MLDKTNRLHNAVSSRKGNIVFVMYANMDNSILNRYYEDNVKMK